jgi:hypothetical protein
VPSISHDGSDLYLFFEDWPAADTVFFAHYNSTTGTWDSEPTFFFTDVYLNDAETITSWVSATDGQLGMAEVNGTAGPKQELRFALLNLPVTRYNVTFASSGIASDANDSVVVTVGATGYSMAGMTLNQSQLPYQALFYTGFPAAYNYSSLIPGTKSDRFSWASIDGCGQSTQTGTITVTGECTLTATYATTPIPEYPSALSLVLIVCLVMAVLFAKKRHVYS